VAAEAPDHGGGVDAAVRQYGGARETWIDLSTGINPVAYPVPQLSPNDWCGLPDVAGTDALMQAARRFWHVPDDAAVLAAPGASSLIARIPALMAPGKVWIPAPTYNEHGRAFAAAGWDLQASHMGGAAVLVHPNNPDGRVWATSDVTGDLCIIDESFCDVMPGKSLIFAATRPGVIVLKSFGKFWGLAGLRLGFAIGDRALIARLAQMLGPWPVSGPALKIGAMALRDTAWAEATRLRLERDAARLDQLVTSVGAKLVGGTSLFRLYDADDAKRWQDSLARHQIWTRIFPYSKRWLRLGLPGSPGDWTRLATALEHLETGR
jgi:cobalamin biosynthesis protein CobC